MRAVALLSFWKLRNSLRTLFTDPRKYVPALIFFGLMGFSLSMSALGASEAGNARTVATVTPNAGLFEAALFLAVSLISMAAFDSGLGDGLIAFALSDVDFLFPSPISRRIVLLYRLPVLTFSAIFSCAFLLYMYYFLLRVMHIVLPDSGHQDPPWWLGPACVSMCLAAYLNLAMFVAIQFEQRKIIHRMVLGCFVAALSGLGLTYYFGGLTAFLAVVDFPILRAVFFPCGLAARGLSEGAHHVSDFMPAVWLLVIYGCSLVPMFATNANFYEQSIVSSEKVAAVRKAARSGFAAQQSARAANFKYKPTREYTIPPFGQGSMALVWAHLCAAAKKPFLNFIGPTLAGIGCGAFGALADRGMAHMGVGIVVAVGFYLSMGLMTSARTASEAAVRRRDLIAPLPLPGWQCVAANLAAPWIAMGLFSIGAGISYGVGGGLTWPIVCFGMCLTFPLRLGARMTLQYILVLSFPDFSDKVQQLLSQGVYYLCAVPFIVGELIVLIPAFLLQSLWVGLIALTLIQVFYLAIFLWLAGVASDRAVASGEPVKIMGLLSRG